MCSNSTTNGIPIFNFSGVGSFIIMFVGIKGPSSSSTMAVTKGTSSTNPGCGALCTIEYVNRVAFPLALIHLVSFLRAPGDISLG